MTTAASSPAVLFRERVLPTPAVWLVGAIGGAIFGVILVPISTLLAAVVAVLMAIGVCVLLAVASPVIEVTDTHLRAGTASIEAEHLGEASPLDRAAWDRVMGVDFEPLAFHCTRPWARAGVRVEVEDPDDPAPAWVISSRDPMALAAALEAQRAGVVRTV